MSLRADLLDANAVAVLLVAVGWWWASVAAVRAGRLRAAGWSAGVALATTAAYLAPVLAPVAAAAWYAFGLAAPQGVLTTGWRRGGAVTGFVLAGVASALLAADASFPPTWAVALTWGVVAVAAGTALALRYLRAAPEERAQIQLLCAAACLGTAFAGGISALSLLVSVPEAPAPWIVGALVLLPLAASAGWSSTRAKRAAERLLIESVTVAGTALLTGAVYLVVVVGLGRPPGVEERQILALSLVAAVILAVLALPVRNRLLALGRSLVGGRAEGAEQVLSGFGARMSRAIPMDELLLQLVESLHATIAPSGAEVWVGDEGSLSRTVSVPHSASARLELDADTRRVVGAARIGGRAWVSIWLPALLAPQSELEVGAAVEPVAERGAVEDLRVVPLAHLGTLLGLLVVRCPADRGGFDEDKEALLVDLARQLGLALHNVGLDSALQASLTELEKRNAELQASRLRIVTASDESRRAIERNLHDGAQQHLVALAIKLGVAAELVEDPDALSGLLTDLRSDVSATIEELRSLAHGIYPPLLRERGLGEALRAAAIRSPLTCRVSDELPGRLSAEVEAAAYFCCLEALQNAAKHAGADAVVDVRLSYADGNLCFEATDDGLGFEPGSVPGHGFQNMTDRLGALGGSLQVISALGEGTSVRGRIAIPADAAVG